MILYHKKAFYQTNRVAPGNLEIYIEEGEQFEGSGPIQDMIQMMANYYWCPARIPPLNYDEIVFLNSLVIHRGWQGLGLAEFNSCRLGLGSSSFTNPLGKYILGGERGLLLQEPLRFENALSNIFTHNDTMFGKATEMNILVTGSSISKTLELSLQIAQKILPEAALMILSEKKDYLGYSDVVTIRTSAYIYHLLNLGTGIFDHELTHASPVVKFNLDGKGYDYCRITKILLSSYSGSTVRVGIDLGPYPIKMAQFPEATHQYIYCGGDYLNAGIFSPHTYTASPIPDLLPASSEIVFKAEAAGGFQTHIYYVLQFFKLLKMEVAA
jgi:hypothetical protein